MASTYIFLNSAINRIVNAPGDQGRIVAMAVAFAVAAAAPLPSSPVDDHCEFYMQQVQQVAIEKISDINEGVIFGSKLALEFTQQFWKQRYYAAHPQILIDSNLPSSIQSILNNEMMETIDFSAIMSGGLFVLSLDTVRFLNKYKSEIAQLTFAISTYLKPDAEVGA